MITSKTNSGILIVQIFSAILSIFLVTTACTKNGVKPTTINSIDNNYGLIETVNLRFDRPLIIKTPVTTPINTEQHILTALFYFENEEYSLAAEEFDKARHGIANRGKLYSNCLIAIAVCRLLLDDNAGFMKTVNELKNTYNSYELMTINDIDERIHTIINLHDSLKNNGNY